MKLKKKILQKVEILFISLGHKSIAQGCQEKNQKVRGNTKESVGPLANAENNLDTDKKGKIFNAFFTCVTEH